MPNINWAHCTRRSAADRNIPPATAREAGPNGHRLEAARS
jgi:hypothetical protein